MPHLRRGARVSKEIIKGVMNFHCNDTAEIEEEAHVVKFKMPSTHAFNYNVTLDVFYEKDDTADCWRMNDLSQSPDCARW